MALYQRQIKTRKTASFAALAVGCWLLAVNDGALPEELRHTGEKREEEKLASHLHTYKETQLTRWDMSKHWRYALIGALTIATGISQADNSVHSLSDIAGTLYNL